MAHPHQVVQFFTSRTVAFETANREHSRQFNRIANLRLGLVVSAGVGGWLLYSQGYYWLFFAAAVVVGSLFSFLMAWHTRCAYHRIKADTLYKVNLRGLRRVTGDWVSLPAKNDVEVSNKKESDRSTGANYRDTRHRYTEDLDIFGENSLYHFINATTTFYGQELLAKRLSAPVLDHEELLARQGAIRALADQIEWCQQLESEGKIAQAGAKDPKLLIHWAEENTGDFARRPFYKKVIQFLPVITFVAIAMTVSFGWPYQILFVCLCGHLLMMAYNYIVLTPFFTPISDNQKELQSFYNLVKAVEKKKFSDPYLDNLRAAFGEGADSAAREISRLTRIMDMTDIRFNPLMHFVLNFLFLWDYHCYAALEKWKANSGKKIKHWLMTIAAFEELISFAGLAFSQPTWSFPAFPTITRDGDPSTPPVAPVIEACDLGHPLIPERERVVNSFKMGASGKVFLITGSNMSGKSTFLRTTGINLVLAYAGAPVCARELTCSVMNLSTSMRTHDNLENHVSSFYAEVLRIKTIIDAAGRGETMLFLIDEIFKGTNSHDRQFGAEMIIRNLHRPGLLGMVSTHDLILGELANDKKLAVENFHFRETYENDEIRFDYKLRPGVSATTNGLYLLKMVGISAVPST